MAMMMMLVTTLGMIMLAMKVLVMMLTEIRKTNKTNNCVRRQGNADYNAGDYDDDSLHLHPVGTPLHDIFGRIPMDFTHRHRLAQDFRQTLLQQLIQ